MQPVYMYHGVGAGAELEGADRHYAVPPAEFRRHLARIGRSVAPARQLREQRAVAAPAITFDDGHRTHFTHAFPALAEAGMQAEFYVNTALIGRQGFVDWPQLRQMAAAGMSIQSHGHRHVFLADLDLPALRQELERSKKAIEDQLGREVIVLAPPGGRYDRRTVEVAFALGYHRLAVSRPGLWRRIEAATIPRFPVYAHTAAETVESYLRPWSKDTLRAVLRYRAVRSGQGLLGNQRYDQLRNRLRKSAEPGAASGQLP